jgi:hypothetical protein
MESTDLRIGARDVPILPEQIRHYRAPVAVDANDVPEALRFLIPFAERWGVGDDGYRDEAVMLASSEERQAVIDAVSHAPDDELSGWLAGPESRSTKPTEAYLHFTCLLMACDLARLLEERRT